MAIILNYSEHCFSISAVLVHVWLDHHWFLFDFIRKSHSLVGAGSGAKSPGTRQSLWKTSLSQGVSLWSCWTVLIMSHFPWNAIPFLLPFESGYLGLLGSAGFGGIFLALSHGIWNFLNQGFNLCPLQYKYKVLISDHQGSPGRGVLGEDLAH